jgi:hypothetical protein
MQYSTVRDGPAGRARSGRCLCECSTPGFGRILHAEDATHQAGERQIVLRRHRMRDDHMRHELHQRVVGRSCVFIEIDDDVGRRQRTDLVEIDVLGAADLGDGGHDVPGMDAETRAAEELRRQTQVAQ